MAEIRKTKANPKKTELVFTRPKGRSVADFKSWVMATARALNPDAEDDMSPEEWERGCKEFWAGIPDK